MTFSAGSYADAKDILTALYAFPYRSDLHDVTVMPRDGTASADIAAQPVSVRLTLTLYEKLGPESGADKNASDKNQAPAG